MSRNGQFDPGGRDYQNGAPINPPTHVYLLYDPSREYRQEGMVETTAVQEGLTTFFGQARRTPNSARLVAAEMDVDRDGFQSLAYPSNLAIQSEQVANHRLLSHPVQATPSDESSDSSDETAGNLEPLGLRVDNQPLVTPRTEVMSRQCEVRAETNQQRTAYDIGLASDSNRNHRQMNSGYTPTTNQLATRNQVADRAAASQGAEHLIPNPENFYASLIDYMGQEEFYKKWWKCKNSFQDKTNVDSDSFADQMICFINVANQIKCLECNNSCDINVKFEHKALCPIKHAYTQITSPRSEQVADHSGPQGATGFTPTFVPPSAELLVNSRGNREMRPANQGLAGHSEQHGGQHCEVTQPHLVHLQDTCQQKGKGIPYKILKANMAETYQRERSFNGWRHRSANLRPKRLAEAGLYFTGEKDACCCFSCGGILHRWEEDDDPWVEHARLHPNCSFVRYFKGGAFIDQVRIKK